MFTFVDFLVDGIYVFARGYIDEDKCGPLTFQENGKDYGLFIFRVQTFPKKSGLLEFIVDCRNPGVVGSQFVNLFTYTTTKPFPYGITYAVFGSKNTTAASYRIRDVDRLPTVFPIADCREGYNTGLTTTGTGAKGEVTVTPLNIEAPVSIGNVAANQKWCVIDGPDSCKPCGSSGARGHVQTRDMGKVVNTDGCKFLRAEPEPNGKVTWTEKSNEATKFKFVVAPNTEIHQIRFNNGTCGSPDYVLTWNSDDEFENGEGKIVAQLGYKTDPLQSCFKIYRFLSNVYNRK